MEQTIPQTVSRESLGAKVGLFSTIGNVVLFVCKYLAGTLCGNVAVLAESFDNLMDSLNSLLVILGFHMSGRKEDYLHPYGHGRCEYVLGLIIAITIILTGAAMLRESILWILYPPDRSFPAVVYGGSALSILVKYAMSLYTSHMNKQLDSSALKACEQNEAADIRMTLLTVGSACLYSLSGFSVDGVVGIVISGLILKDGLKSFAEHFVLLLGEGVSGQQMAQIQAIFDCKKDMVTLKKVDLHDYGPESRIISLQVTVNPVCSPVEVNTCMDSISEDIKALGLCPAFSLSMEQILV